MAEVGQDLSRVDIVEAGLDAQLGLLSMDEQTALGERLAGRFGWRAAGDLAVAESTVFTLDRDDYDLTVTALGDLGVKNTRKQQPIPEFEEVAEAVKPVASYLGGHVERGDQPELTFHIPVAKHSDRTNGLYKLIKGFDKGQEYDTSIWSELWDRLGNNHLKRYSSETNPKASILLNDTTDPADRTRPANGYGEAGLVYISQTVPEQKKSLNTEQDEEANKDGVHLNLEFADITEYLVTQAKRSQAGLPLLDKPTVTRFPQYTEPGKDGFDLGGDVCVPDAGVDGDDRLRLRGSDVGGAWGSGGVRRVVRVA